MQFRDSIPVGHHSVFTIRVEPLKMKILHCLANVGFRLPIDAISCPRRTECLTEFYEVDTCVSEENLLRLSFLYFAVQKNFHNNTKLRFLEVAFLCVTCTYWCLDCIQRVTAKMYLDVSYREDRGLVQTLVLADILVGTRLGTTVSSRSLL